jgi:protein-disulfide isomerase
LFRFGKVTRMDKPATNLATPISKEDHILGPDTAAVTLLEYGDYQCPFCADAYSMIKKVIKQMGPKLRFVFRNMPLNEVHPYAQFAAEAAEAAGAQGKFWEMHDAIYEHQTELGSDLVHTLGRKLRLDLVRFDADMESRRCRARVKNDFMSGMRSGVAGTPTLFINGERYHGSIDEKSLVIAIRKKIP